MLDATRLKSGLDNLLLLWYNNHFRIARSLLARLTPRIARTRQQKSAVGQEGKRKTRMSALRIPKGSAERTSCFEMALRNACVTRLLQRSSFQLSTFDCQLLSHHTLIDSVSANSSDSRTYKRPRMCIKTMGFKTRRITHFPRASSQTLWNHTLPKTGVGGGEVASDSCEGRSGRPQRLLRVPTLSGGGCAGECFQRVPVTRDERFLPLPIPSPGEGVSR